MVKILYDLKKGGACGYSPLATAHTRLRPTTTQRHSHKTTDASECDLLNDVPSLVRSVWSCRNPLLSAVSAADSIAPITSAALGVRSLSQARSVTEGKRWHWFGDALKSHGDRAWMRGEWGRHSGAFVSGCGAGVRRRRPRVRYRHEGRLASGGGGMSRDGGEALTSPACAAPAAMLARCSRRPCAPPHSHRRRGSRCRLASVRRRSSPASLARARGRLSRRSARGVLRTAASRVGCCSSPAQQAAAGSYGAAWRDASA